MISSAIPAAFLAFFAFLAVLIELESVLVMFGRSAV